MSCSAHLLWFLKDEASVYFRKEIFVCRMEAFSFRTSTIRASATLSGCFLMRWGVRVSVLRPLVDGSSKVNTDVCSTQTFSVINPVYFKALWWGHRCHKTREVWFTPPPSLTNCCKSNSNRDKSLLKVIFVPCKLASFSLRLILKTECLRVVSESCEIFSLMFDKWQDIIAVLFLIS